MAKSKNKSKNDVRIAQLNKRTLISETLDSLNGHNEQLRSVVHAANGDVFAIKLGIDTLSKTKAAKTLAKTSDQLVVQNGLQMLMMIDEDDTESLAVIKALNAIHIAAIERENLGNKKP